ncbi:MAG: acyl-CoA dehydrogenase family protein [Steroidobacteraceae bacterium]
MDFDYSPEERELQRQARRFLEDHYPPARMRAALEREDPAAGRALFQAMADLGWTGIGIAEEEGGIGMGKVGLCALAEELGRALVPGPFASTVYGLVEALQLAGTADQRLHWLGGVAAGRIAGCVALAEGPGDPDATSCEAEFLDGRLHGVKWPVTDGELADVSVVLAREGSGTVLLLVDLREGVIRTPIGSIDGSRPVCRLKFQGVPAERLGTGVDGRTLAAALLDRMAVPLAFEQLGGADRCLEMARAHALDRHAFGRPIGGFQAIKHRLVDMYARNELARSNAYYAAWALEAGAAELRTAAAAARLAAIEAFEFAARETLQIHGGIAITWAAHPHLFLRRSRQLGAVAGSPDYWGERLIGALAAGVPDSLKTGTGS